VNDSLWTPARDASCKPNLLRIVGYVGAEAKDCAAEMSIWTFDDLVLLHIWLEGPENDLETSVIKLTAKPLKFRPLSLALTSYIVY
jgi:hypothetical protein